ncbi:Chromo domain-containing protein [Heracleum sosnowskyi]|uniref:Chromo domain-containing protein n=1 Tax=Heracleum sosnowskyi TaxID=360622 RepID=A0AAD8IE91_9APIA|nr:Chromo domain-containing protein [Heracleum sosnowskyi]
MDFVEQLPISNGKDVVLVIVDRFSKYGHFIALKHPFTSLEVVEVFLDNIFKLHGLPDSIVCDRDRIFTRNFWTTLFDKLGITMHFSSAYHPHLKCSPFEVLYGTKPVPLNLGGLQDMLIPVAQDMLQQRNLVLQVVKESLLKAQHRMKFFADQKRTERSFNLGDWVYMKLKPYRQQSVAIRTSLKLCSKFFGPFQVLEKIGTVAYKLKLPTHSKVHPVFNVSLLKKHVGSTPIIAEELPEMNQDDVVVL